jgi:hypothetical protein
MFEEKKIKGKMLIIKRAIKKGTCFLPDSLYLK